MVHHGGFYYLFVSYGDCCKGVGSTYEILVGRSQTITGPFLDPNGTAMSNGGGMGEQGSTDGMIGAAGPSVALDGSTYLIDYHYYDAWALARLVAGAQALLGRRRLAGNRRSAGPGAGCTAWLLTATARDLGAFGRSVENRRPCVGTTSTTGKIQAEGSCLGVVTKTWSWCNPVSRTAPQLPAGGGRFPG